MTAEYVHILSRQQILHRLLKDLLQNEKPWQLKSLELLDEAIYLPSSDHDKRIILIDYLSVDHETLPALIQQISKDTTRLLAIFNVAETDEAWNDLIPHGLKGVFFQNDPTELYLKGLEAIFFGDLWFSRESLVRSIMQHSGGIDSNWQLANDLSMREQEILNCIAQGESNKRIATELNLSEHTIKSHVYHIYRKIGVNKRVDAARWALKYLNKPV